jgi:hypothetical protein
VLTTDYNWLQYIIHTNINVGQSLLYILAPAEQPTGTTTYMWYDNLLTAIGLSPGSSTQLHTNNTQNNTNNNQTTQITTNVEECGPCPIFASFTLAFALQQRKKHRKASVRLRKTSVRVQYTYYQNIHTLQNPHKHTVDINKLFIIFSNSH